LEPHLSDVARNQTQSVGGVAPLEEAPSRQVESSETKASIFQTLHGRLKLWGVGGLAYIQIPHIGSFDFHNPIRVNKGLPRDVEAKSRNTLADYICCLTWSPQNQLGCFLLPIKGDESANVLRQAYSLCDQAHHDLSRAQALLNAQNHARSKLTAREKSIMELVVHGKSAPDIANILNLSPHTVSNLERASRICRASWY